jgi:DNA-binding transcriptional LysR family regulator
VRVWPQLPPWLPKCPDIHIEISSDNRFTDIVADRFDIGVRLGGDVARDMIAVRIAPDMRMVVVGSLTYFAARSIPLTLHDLDDMAWLGYRATSPRSTWTTDRSSTSSRPSRSPIPAITSITRRGGPRRR